MKLRRDFLISLDFTKANVFAAATSTRIMHDQLVGVINKRTSTGANAKV